MHRWNYGKQQSVIVIIITSQHSCQIHQSAHTHTHTHTHTHPTTKQAQLRREMKSKQHNRPAPTAAIPQKMTCWLCKKNWLMLVVLELPKDQSASHILLDEFLCNSSHVHLWQNILVYVAAHQVIKPSLCHSWTQVCFDTCEVLRKIFQLML